MRRLRQMVWCGVLVASGVAAQTDFAQVRDAIRSGKIEALKGILDADPAAVRVRDEQGWTPLHLAALVGNVDAVDLLLARGADINAKDMTGRTPVFMPIPFDQGTTLTRLLERGAELSARTDSGATLLQYALSWERPQMADLLVARGATLPTDRQGSEAMLWEAAALGSRGVVDRIVRQGADLSPRTRGCGTLLHSAARGGLAAFCATLLDKGAKPGEPDCHGLTPLHLAAWRGRTDVVRLLIDRGAAVGARSPDGRTARDLAETWKQAETVRLLETKGAVAGPPVFPGLSGPYLGQRPPGAVPEIFAPGIVSTELPEGQGTFAPDGRTYIFARSPGGDARYVLLATTVDGDRWSVPAKPSFAPEGWDMEPAFSPDGGSVFFVSMRSADPGGPNKRDWDVWVADRTPSGWSAARHLGEPISTPASEFFPTGTRDGTLYFQRGGLLRAGREGKGYGSPQDVGAAFRGLTALGHPWVSPDESLLLFDARREGASESDLYVTFRERDGVWSSPRPLGSEVNTPESELGAALSPDGRYLFFQRGGDIWWMDAEFLTKLRP